MKHQHQTRLEVIENGIRKYNKWDCEITSDIQDDGKTLKIFVDVEEESK